MKPSDMSSDNIRLSGSNVLVPLDEMTSKKLFNELI